MMNETAVFSRVELGRNESKVNNDDDDEMACTRPTRPDNQSHGQTRLTAPARGVSKRAKPPAWPIAYYSMENACVA